MTFSSKPHYSPRGGVDDAFKMGDMGFTSTVLVIWNYIYSFGYDFENSEFLREEFHGEFRLLEIPRKSLGNKPTQGLWLSVDSLKTLAAELNNQLLRPTFSYLSSVLSGSMKFLVFTFDGSALNIC